MSLEQETKFKVGDIVEAFGVRGRITAIGLGRYPIEVQYENFHSNYFTADGKILAWHKEPTLKLIERPKKKVKKVFHGYINIYPIEDITSNNNMKAVFSSRALADEMAEAASLPRIACIEIHQEYEVEE